jgi:hypothetical protein
MPPDNDIQLNLTPMQCRLILEALIAVGSKNPKNRSQSETVKAIAGQINTQLPPQAEDSQEEPNDSTW